MRVMTAGTAWFTVWRYAARAHSAQDPEAWFPISTIPAQARQEAAEALAVCGTCPVLGLCLELSLLHWKIGQHGIWGGTLPSERKLIRAARAGLAVVRNGRPQAGTDDATKEARYEPSAADPGH